MELAAARRPFVYVPLENHFEQNLHVRHRLERYGAGTCMRYAEAGARFVEHWQESARRIHVIGKNVTRFHCVYWPAILESAGLRASCGNSYARLPRR